MSDYTLLNFTGLSLSIDTPDKTASSSIVDRNVTAFITNTDRPDQVVTAALPSRSKRTPRRDVGWREIPLKMASDRASFRTDKMPLLDKVADIVTDSQDIPGYKAFFKQAKDPRNPSTVLVLPRIDLARHLSVMPDHTSLADLLLPGTHDSVAFYGWPFTQCQEIGCTLTTQLNEGIRFFDIRLKLKRGILLAFHGPWPQLTTFQTMLSEISQFLSINPHETLIVCIQQETSLHPDFSRTVREDMQGTIDAGKWFLENRVPTLGEVRGKAVLMSRFGGGDGPDGSIPWEVPVGWGRNKEVRMGWRPNRWPDSVIEGFEWECGTTEVRTQDWYEIHGVFNIPAKSSVLTDHLLSGSHLPSRSNLTLSFSSAGSIPFALPSFVAKGFGWPDWGLGYRGVNELLRDWLLDRLEAQAQARHRGPGSKPSSGPADEEERIRGIVPMDYYRKFGIVDVMLAYNTVQVGLKTELYA
ncbi:hypothetical protein FFLO_02632 [Filobasidium floriforme]|uniref:Phosphatidylinositol-specific phospholipase C X domain-containing protein n=1 Tax=Filobasidium floriforme TaxID=5210 RepID=A0A8K0NNY1_9TREE|nr:hypothetical protein FFLO_02632 [Filobasidium floriforme]